MLNLRSLAPFLLLTVFTHPCPAALNLNQNAANGMARAYGFLLGQEYSLRQIEAKYPHLSAPATIARLEFQSAFPDAKQRLESQLLAALGKDAFAKLQRQLEGSVASAIQQKTVSEDQGRDFIAQVRGRAKGESIEPKELRYLLAVCYEETPTQEFTKGFRQSFRSDGSGKALGVAITLKVPTSWLPEEGERPHIVQKWTNEGGTGLSSILLSVTDTDGADLSPSEIRRFVRSGEAKTELSELGTVHAVELFSLENIQGYRVDLSMKQERVGVTIYQRAEMYQVPFRGKIISIMCMSGAEQSKRSQADAAAKRLAPLCRQVVNSLVLPQSY